MDDHGAPLRLYNSLSRSTEAFRPIDRANVRVYSCGPTVYHYAHIGNLRAYVFTDTLSRTLTWKGYDLTHVINITDVGHLTSDADDGDDKMEAAAKRAGTDIWEVARHYTAAFERNLDELNIRRPTHMPRATDFVPQMIEWGSAIEDHCYPLDDGLYFDVSTVSDYGRLARSSDDVGESRIDPVAGKRQPQDFAIWRASHPDEQRQMEWDSPWGRGAPGWHLECSVMAKHFLGERFDIHTGGIDHREIHHPNEIAQNQARSGTADSGAAIWMHNNFLVERQKDQAGVKMSKSSGEFLTLQALIDRGYHPLAYRLMCLQAHYRSELEFSWENLGAAFTRLKRIFMGHERMPATALANAATSPIDAADTNLAEFDAALGDDLNTPVALTVFERVLGQKGLGPDYKRAVLLRMDEALGLGLATLTRADLRVRPADATIDATAIEQRLTERREARAAKDFARSDALRDELAAAGVEVMDGDPLGWDWKLPA